MIEYIPLRKRKYFADKDVEETVIDGATVLDQTVVDDNNGVIIGKEDEVMQGYNKLSEKEQEEIYNLQNENDDLLAGLDTKKILLYIYTEDNRKDNPFFSNVTSRQGAMDALVAMNADYREVENLRAIIGDIQKIHRNIIVIGLPDWKFDCYWFEGSEDLYVYGHLNDIMNGFAIDGEILQMAKSGCNLKVGINDVRPLSSFDFQTWTKAQQAEEDGYVYNCITSVLPLQTEQIEISTTNGQYGFKDRLGSFGFLKIEKFLSKI